jgi:hypothetical protein
MSGRHGDNMTTGSTLVIDQFIFLAALAGGR